MLPPDSTPPPSSSHPPPQLPVEIIRSILSRLHPVKDHATLSSVSLSSKIWHEITFPFLHHTLVLARWSPASVDELKDDLKADKKLARSVRHLELPRVMQDANEWKEFWQFVNAESLRQEWMDQASDELCVRCGMHHCIHWMNLAVEGTFRMGRKKAAEMLEKEEDAAWMKDRVESENAFFGLIQLLPELESVELWEFHFHVERVIPAKPRENKSGEDKKEKESAAVVDEIAEAVEGVTLGGVGGTKKEEVTTIETGATRKRGPGRPLSYIKHVSLHGCSPTFKRSLKNHWRFSKVVKLRVFKT